MHKNETRKLTWRWRYLHGRPFRPAIEATVEGFQLMITRTRDSFLWEMIDPTYASGRCGTFEEARAELLVMLAHREGARAKEEPSHEEVLRATRRRYAAIYAAADHAAKLPEGEHTKCPHARAYLVIVVGETEEEGKNPPAYAAYHAEDAGMALLLARQTGVAVQQISSHVAQALADAGIRHTSPLPDPPEEQAN